MNPSILLVQGAPFNWCPLTNRLSTSFPSSRFQCSALLCLSYWYYSISLFTQWTAPGPEQRDRPIRNAWNARRPCHQPHVDRMQIVPREMVTEWRPFWPEAIHKVELSQTWTPVESVHKWSRKSSGWQLNIHLYWRWPIQTQVTVDEEWNTVQCGDWGECDKTERRNAMPSRGISLKIHDNKAMNN
jgi:hypothetical protein